MAFDDFDQMGYISDELTRVAEAAYEKTGRLLDEHAAKMEKAVEQMTSMHKKVMDAVAKQTDELFTRTWKGMWVRLGEQTTQILSESVSRSLRLSISSSMLSDLKPGFGNIGTSLGQTLGKAAGEAIGAAWGPIGSMIGGGIGQGVGGFGIDAASMQLEGYRMLGARAVPTAYAGKAGADVDFEKVGREYRVAVKDIVVATGATADAVDKLAQSLSRVGVGFLEGGKAEVEFALAAERAMNLVPGTVEKLQTRTVLQYGESLEVVRGQMQLVNIETTKMAMLSKENSHSFTATWRSAQNLIDAFGQIESGVKNTSVSLESMTEMSRLLLETMGEAGDTRSGAQVKTATDLINAFAPQAGKDLAEEKKRGFTQSMFLERTGMGQNILAQIREAQKKKYLGMGGAAVAEMLSATDESKMFGANYTLSMMAGAADYGVVAGMDKEQGVLQAMGFNLSQPELFRMNESMTKLREMGFSGAKTSKQIEEMEEKNPEFKKRYEEVKNIQERAKKQGDAQLSALDRIANLLTEISAWTNGNYTTMRDRAGQAMGLAEKGGHAGLIDILANITNPAALANVGETVLGHPERKVSMGVTATPGGESTQTSREDTHIPDSTIQHIEGAAGTRSMGVYDH